MGSHVPWRSQRTAGLLQQVLWWPQHPRVCAPAAEGARARAAPRRGATLCRLGRWVHPALLSFVGSAALSAHKATTRTLLILQGPCARHCVIAECLYSACSVQCSVEVIPGCFCCCTRSECLTDATLVKCCCKALVVCCCWVSSCAQV